MAAMDALTLNDWAVLGLLAEREQHGFAISRELDTDGTLGRTWTVPRSLVYHAIDHLLSPRPGRTGAHRRRRPRPSPHGDATDPARTAALRTWLRTPVAHLRDVRSELLLKFTMLKRRGESVAELADHQLEAFRPAFDGLAATARRTTGPERLTDLWRVESSRSVERFLTELGRAH